MNTNQKLNVSEEVALRSTINALRDYWKNRLTVDGDLREALRDDAVAWLRESLDRLT